MKRNTRYINAIFASLLAVGLVAQVCAQQPTAAELDVDKRLKGDYVWFKLGFLF